MSQGHEAIVLTLRQSLYLPLDDLLFITRQYINPAVSRAGIARLLQREGMSRLTDLIATADGEKITPKKTFKAYEPGFIHIDIKYLPQMPDETSRRYLFVAIDRATRWVFMHIYDLSVEVAYGGPEGLASAMTLIPDVIFLDIGMPGMDGDAVARVWRGEARMLDVNIVALTAWGDAASRQEPRAAGFDQHFTKPARIDNMLAIAR